MIPCFNLYDTRFSAEPISCCRKIRLNGNIVRSLSVWEGGGGEGGCGINKADKMPVDFADICIRRGDRI